MKESNMKESNFLYYYIMPYTIRKVRGKKCYSVKKPKGTKRRVMSKCTSLKNAKAQIRLLNAIEYNPKFTPRNN